MSKSTVENTGTRFITSTEIARHVYCARALAYDRAYPDDRNKKTLLKRILQGLAFLWGGTVVILLPLILLLADRPLIALMAFLLGFLLPLLFGLILWTGQFTGQGIMYHGIKTRRNRRQMVSNDYGLSGRPDYLMEWQGFQIPMLSKSCLSPASPFDAHIMQILAHCLLVMADTGQTPPYGVIRYADGRTFEVDFDDDSVDVLLQIMDEMATLRHKISIERSHDERRRCYACSQRNYCDQNLFQ